MTLKKVLLISSLNPKDDIRIFRKEAISLSKKYKVEYLCAGKEKYETKDNGILINILKKPTNVIQRFQHLIDIRNFINKNEAAVFHLQNPELLLLVPFIKRKYKNSKVIFDMHEDFEEAIKDKKWIPSLLRGMISTIYTKYLNKLLNKQLDYTIVTTPLIRKKFKTYENVGIIENFAPLMHDLPKIEKTPLNIQACINKSKNETKIVFTGLINKQRGIYQVVDAIKRADNSVLILIGIYSKEFKEEFDEYISRNSLENQVFLFSSVSYEEMIAAMLQMDIGILPYLPIGNHVVTRPNKLFEYMLASLPVISSNFPLYEEITKQGVGISVDPTNPKEIAEAIDYITVNNKDNKYGEKGNRLYKEKYNWDTEEKKLFNIYKSLLGD